MTTGCGSDGNSVVVTTSSLSCSKPPPQCGQQDGTAAVITSEGGCDGAFRRRKTPSPGFRPGRFGFATAFPLENGAAWRLPSRRNRSTSFRNCSIKFCCSRISSISSCRPNDSRSATRTLWSGSACGARKFFVPPATPPIGANQLPALSENPECERIGGLLKKSCFGVNSEVADRQ